MVTRSIKLLNIISSKNKPLRKIAILISPLLYILLWNMIIRYDLFSFYKQLFQVSSSSSSGLLANIHVSANAEALVWRMKIIPIYWSKIGNLSIFHNLFMLFYFGYLAKSYILTNYHFNFNRLGYVDNLNKIKKFWLVYGIIAFLTTSFSFLPVINAL